MAEAPEIDLTTCDLNTTIQIVLKDNDSTFTVHKDIICANSPFAKQCLEGGFQEAQDQIVPIGDWKDETSVRRLINWLYKGKAMFKEEAQKIPNTQMDVSNAEVKLTELYILADRMMMVKLKNDILDAFGDLQGRRLSEMVNFDVPRLLTKHELNECKLMHFVIIHTIFVLGRRCQMLNGRYEGRVVYSEFLSAMDQYLKENWRGGIRIMRLFLQAIGTNTWSSSPDSKKFHEGAQESTET